MASIQEWEPATEYAIKALSAADLTDGGKSLVLCRLASLDIMTWRDAQGWEHAVQAEQLARAEGTDTLIASALLQKGRLQLCGAITEGEAQDEEALGTLREALEFASGSPNLQADILLQLSQAYIGLNRFKTPIDREIYEKAGSYINQAVALSTDPSFPSRALPYWMRWYRQGGNWQDGIECCHKVLEGLGKEDYLMQSQCWNNLVMLYAQSGDVENAASAHQQYVYAMEYYMQQKADTRLQDMETRYETSLKEARLSRMRLWVTILIILAVALIGIIALTQVYIRKIVASDRGKEQLLRLISKDLASPRLADSPAPDYSTIRARCHELLGEDDSSMADEIASYITNLAEERSRRVKELGLTAREIEVIRLSAEGLSVAGIAERLHVSIYTIKNHKQNIYLKMDVRSNAEMLRLANELGIV
ncbi:MAG: response regulator transcription factor [Bacteroidales bacterium]|nr:response regulator transcription factor [Bacteroidales bacterium]MBR0174384.1 response regulator transcription factor [Bacteroidales bacterium]